MNLESNTSLSCTLTKQKQKTRVAQGGNNIIHYNETMVFFINSQYQIHGRSFTVELLNKDKVVGIGMISIDEIINRKGKITQSKFLSTVTRKNLDIWISNALLMRLRWSGVSYSYVRDCTYKEENQTFHEVQSEGRSGRRGAWNFVIWWSGWKFTELVWPVVNISRFEIVPFRR